MKFTEISDTIKWIIFKGGFSLKDENVLNNETKEEILLEKASAEKSYSNDALTDELESLAQTFREELKKAQELSDEEFVEAYADDLGIIPEEELCECCGERRKDKTRGEKYQYCSVCRESMKSYPLSVPNLLVSVALVVVSILSVVLFCNDFYGYNMMYKAEKAEKENKISSAIKYYDATIDEFSEGNITPKRAYLYSAVLMYETMENGTASMTEISDRIDIALSDFAKKLPVFSPIADIQLESEIIFATMQEFYNIIGAEEYANYTSDDKEMYKEIMTKIGALIDKEVSIVSKDGKTTQMHPSNAAMVRFCQYMFAYISENYDDSYQYMLEVEKLEPDYLWLYAYELGIVETQTGDVNKAKELAQAIIKKNVEDPDGYSLYTSVERLNGNFEKATRWADKGLEYSPENAELMRLKAMALCCKGDLEEAKAVIDEALKIQEYAVLYFTAIVVENELGNTDAVESYKTALKEENVEISERMTKYLSGKLTVLQLFTEGTGEVE